LSVSMPSSFRGVPDPDVTTCPQSTACHVRPQRTAGVGRSVSSVFVGRTHPDLHSGNHSFGCPFLGRWGARRVDSRPRGSAVRRTHGSPP